MTLPVLSPLFALGPQKIAGLAWQSIAVDRSLATGVGFNLNTIVRGGGGYTAVATRWSAKVGAGAEGVAVVDSILCNTRTGSYRALLSSVHLRSSGAGSGGIGEFSDVTVIEGLAFANAAPGLDTGFFLMQWDGTTATLVLPSAGGRGIGVMLGSGLIQAWSSSLGGIGVPFNIGNANALVPFRITLQSARLGQEGSFLIEVNGISLASGSLFSAVGAGYAIGKSSYVLIESASAGPTLSTAELSILTTRPGYL